MHNNANHSGEVYTRIICALIYLNVTIHMMSIIQLTDILTFFNGRGVIHFGIPFIPVHALLPFFEEESLLFNVMLNMTDYFRFRRT